MRKRGVIGILFQDNKVLMVQRAAHLIMGGAWCFPGGHIEQGETSDQALVRELKEELGLEVTCERRLGEIEVANGYVLDVFIASCARLALQPSAHEIAEVRWVSSDEISIISPGLPSNRQAEAMLRDAMPNL